MLGGCSGLVVLGGFLAGDSKNICLIGPVGAGKSALVASLAHAVERSLHGFAPNRTFSFSGWFSDQGRPTDPLDEFAEMLRPGEQKKLELAFLAQGQSANLAGFASTRLATLVYRFRIDNVPCNVIDTGGELLQMELGSISYSELRTAKPKNQARSKPFDDFITRLTLCDCLILTIPLLEFEEAIWAPRLNMILTSLLALNRPPRLERIIVAWTRYDVLLAPFGPFAATLACDPRRGHKAVELALEKYSQISNLLDRLQDRLSKDVIFPIHHIPVSSHGFIARNGAAFTHLNKDFEHHLGPQAAFRDESLSDVWRPFLSADPILAAAVGIGDHRYFFSHSTFRSSPGNEAASRGSWISVLWQFISNLFGRSDRRNAQARTSRK